MLLEVQKNILHLKGKLGDKQKKKSILDEAILQYRQTDALLKRAREKMESEKADLAKLEEEHFWSWFYSVLGNRTEKIEKEKQEFVAAKLKFELFEKSLKETQALVDQFRHELSLYDHVESDLEIACGIARELILKENTPRTGYLMELEEKLISSKSDQKESQEAVDAGVDVVRVLTQGIEELRSAKGWGTFDMLGGGVLATAVKHSKIQAANQFVSLAQSHINRFRRELADIRRKTDLDVKVEGFSLFADYFFDGIIADWFVQSKIVKSLQACETTLSQVEEIIENCRNHIKTLIGDIRVLELERAKILEGSL